LINTESFLTLLIMELEGVGMPLYSLDLHYRGVDLGQGKRSKPWWYSGPDTSTTMTVILIFSTSLS
jgi:hypothetical protein